MKDLVHPALDSAGTAFFKRELEASITRSLKVKYADIVFRQLFPINRSLDPADETYTVEIYDAVGMAKIIGAYGQDLPRADVSAREVSYPLRSFGTSIGFSVQEIRAAKRTGKPLRQQKADAARRATEQALQNVAFNGDATSGLAGFLSNSNIPQANVTVGATSGNSVWEQKTPDEIVFDIDNIFSTMFEDTNMVERAKILLLPVKKWTYINSTRLTDTNETIMSYIIRTSQWIQSADQIRPLNELKGAGVGSTDRMVAYDPNPTKLEMHIPMELTFLPPEPRGLEVIVAGEARAGGLQVYYPMSVSFVDGI